MKPSKRPKTVGHSGSPMKAKFKRSCGIGVLTVAIAFLCACLVADGQGSRPDTSDASQVLGRVYRADTGKPVAGLIVLALRPEFDLDGSRRLFPYAKSTTDEQGRFRFNGLSGPYFLGTGGVPQTDSKLGLEGANHNVYYGESYYPENALSELAKPILVKFGTAINNIQIPVRPEPTYTIRGSVEGAATNVFAWPINDWRLFPLPQAQLLTDGSFVVGDVIPGEYVVMAIAVHERKGIQPIVVRGYARVRVTDADARANVRLGEAARVQGTAKIEGPSRLTFRNLEIGLTDPLDGGGGLTTSTLDPRGRFEIGGLSPGEHDFDVFNPKNPRDDTVYVKGAECSGKDYMSRPLVLDVGTVVENCTVVVAQDKVTIHGKVLSGANPGRYLLVVLVPAARGLRRKPDFTRQSVTGSDGDFQIQEVIPGDYLIFAVVGSVDRDYLALDFAERHASYVKHIHVNQNGTEAIVLNVVSQDEATGR